MLPYYIVRTHLALFLSHFSFLTVILRSARRSTIRCYFIAAPRADKERLFCLFQMKKFKWERVEKKHVSLSTICHRIALIENLILIEYIQSN